MRTKSFWLSVLSFTIAILISIFGLINHFKFDGVILQGASSHIGEIKRGQEFVHGLMAFNFSRYPVNLYVMPTCGCTLNSIQEIHINPFSIKRFAIPYKIDAFELGPLVRREIFIYQINGKYHRREGEVYFTMKNRI